MKILITGSSGFVGRNLLTALVDKKHDVVEYDRSHSPLETLDNIENLSKKILGVDIVYHLAGVSDPNSESLKKVNIKGTYNLVQVLKEFNPKAKLIFASTFGVYRIPGSGEMVTENFDIAPRNEYGKSKLEAENIINSINGVTFRISNVYGKGMLAGKHSVVANFIDSILQDKELDVYDANASRDFIYIDDLVSAFLDVLKFNGGGIFNICSSEETRLLDLINKIEEATNKKAKINIVKTKNFSGNWRGDYKKANISFGWMPKVKIDEGLKIILQK